MAVGEALGTAVEGGLLARAVEGGDAPARGGKGHFHESDCLNCGTPLIGSHCHQCGQAAHLHRTISALGHDIAHGVFHLDGKVWRTLPMLAFKPGELTRRYVHGERAKFVSPMALFLFAIFLMFAVFQALGITAPEQVQTREGVQASLDEVRLKTLEAIRADEAKLRRLPAGDTSRAALEADIAKKRDEVEGLEKVSAMSLGGLVNVTSKANTTGIAFIDHGIAKWKKNPGLMLYKLQSNSYKYSWMLIPLSVPFMWLLFFWRRDIKAYDHAIFVTYSIAFMSLLFVVVSVAGHWGAPDGVIVPLALLAPALHLYKQLKGAYRLSRLSTIWRFAALTMFILVVLMLFLQFLLVLGAF